jgi:hypothetical protein
MTYYVYNVQHNTISIGESASEYYQPMVHVSAAYFGHRNELRLHVHVWYYDSQSTVGKISIVHEDVIENNPHHNIINVALQWYLS